MMGNDEDGDGNRTVDQERVQWYGEGGGWMRIVWCQDRDEDGSKTVATLKTLGKNSSDPSASDLSM